jgi:hypothetical protein
MPETFIRFILENIVSTHSKIGLNRSSLPQIRGNDIPNFLKFIKNKGIKVTRSNVKISKLKPTQNKIDLNKVEKKVSNKNLKIKPFIVSKDNYILDGHHQLYALKYLNPNSSAISHVIDLDIEELLNIAKSYPKIDFKSI